MIYQNNDNLRRMLESDNRADLVTRAVFTIDRPAYDVLLAEIHKQKPELNEQERMDRAAFRWLTKIRPTPAQASGANQVLQVQNLLHQQNELLTLQLQRASDEAERQREVDEFRAAMFQSHESTLRAITQNQTETGIAISSAKDSIDSSISSAVGAVGSSITELQTDVDNSLDSIHDNIKTLHDATSVISNNLNGFAERFAEFTADSRKEWLEVKGQLEEARKEARLRRKKALRAGIVLGVIVLLVLSATVSFGQQQTPTLPAVVVAACGTPPATYPGAGGRAPLTVDVNGKNCTEASAAAEQDVDITKVNNAAVNVGVGASGTGTLRVTTSTDSTVGTVTAITNPVTITDGAGALNVIVDSGTTTVTQATGTNLHTVVDSGVITTVGAVTAITNALPTGTNTLGSVKQTDGTNVALVDPCESGTFTITPISLTASTQIITGTSSVKVYICHIHLVVAAATNVALVEGTGSVCATNIAGMAGGSTAATGWNFAANSGIALGNGKVSVMQAAANAANVCLLLSAANQTSGTVKWVTR